MQPLVEQQPIALFPLQVVIFPGSKLNLQIFERRYLDLVSHCMRHDAGFGVCLLRQGKETGQQASMQTIHRTGTYGKIVDWDQLDNGLLGITVEGQQKFHVDDCWRGEDGVLQAQVAFSKQDCLGQTAITASEELAALVDLLRNLANHPLVEQRHITINYENLWELGWRLADFIPITAELRQQLLEQNDPWERIRQIERIVADLASEN